MATLMTALNYASSSPAVIVPETGLHISYHDLKNHITVLQSSLAEIGIAPHSAVTISLINGFEFAVSFLAVGAQRAIAATLNPMYQQSEVEFYVDDIKAALLIVPKGAVEKDSPAVRAARKFGAGVAEIWFDGKHIQLVLKEKGNNLEPRQPVVKAGADDIAVCTWQSEADFSSYYIPVERLVVQKVRLILS
jgi:oxalate---CoA ligase